MNVGITSFLDEELSIDATRFLKIMKDFVEPLLDEFQLTINY